MNTGENAFSLLEILVVVVLIGLMTALLLPNLSRPARGAHPLYLFFLKEQQQAVERWQVARLLLKGKALVSEATGATFALTEAQRFEILVPAASPHLPEATLAILYPDETMTVAEARLWDEGLWHRFSFSPFSGIRHESAPP